MEWWYFYHRKVQSKDSSASYMFCALSDSWIFYISHFYGSTEHSMHIILHNQFPSVMHDSEPIPEWFHFWLESESESRKLNCTGIGTGIGIMHLIQWRPEQVRKNAFAYPWPTKMSKKRAFSASSEILNFENRTIIKGDMAKNVPEGKILAVDRGPSWDLRTSASWAAGMPVIGVESRNFCWNRNRNRKQRSLKCWNRNRNRNQDMPGIVHHWFPHSTDTPSDGVDFFVTCAPESNHFSRWNFVLFSWNASQHGPWVLL